MNFADNLKKLRTSKGLSQKDLANILNVSPSSITMYEIGQREPNFNLLDKIATYFEVSTDYLLGRKNVQTDGELNDIIVNINKLSPEKQKALEILLS